MTPDIEREILDYLREQATDRRDRLERETLRDTAIQRLANEMTLTRQSIEHLDAKYEERFRGLAARVDKLEDDVEDTGQHHVEELQRQLQEARARKHDSVMWWKRSSINWVVGGIGAVLLAALGVVVGWLASHLGGK